MIKSRKGQTKITIINYTLI